MEPAAITDTKPAARRWLGWLGQCGRYCRINNVISGKLLPIKNLCIGKDIAEITRDTLTWFSQRWENFPQRLSLTPAKDALRLIREEVQTLFGTHYPMHARGGRAGGGPRGRRRRGAARGGGRGAREAGSLA